MSSGFSVGITPLASSTAGIAGAARVADANRTTAVGAQTSFKIAQVELSAQLSGDVAQSDATGDRDADGRTPFTFAQAVSGTLVGNDPAAPPPVRAVDALGERGVQLDIDA